MLKEKALRCFEYWSVRQKRGRNAFQNLIYSEGVGQTHSPLEQMKCCPPLIWSPTVGLKERITPKAAVTSPRSINACSINEVHKGTPPHVQSRDPQRTIQWVSKSRLSSSDQEERVGILRGYCGGKVHQSTVGLGTHAGPNHNRK